MFQNVPQCHPGWLSRIFAVAERLDGIVLRELRVLLIRDAVERVSWDGLMEALRGHPVLLAETFSGPGHFREDVLPGRGLDGDWGGAGLRPRRGRRAGAWPSEEGSGALAWMLGRN